MRGQFLAAQKATLTERAYAVEYEAEFVDPAGTVFSTEAIDGCLVAEPDEARAPFAIGVDWGRCRDYTAVIVLCGTKQDACVLESHRFQGGTWSSLRDRVSEIVRHYPGASVKCDQTGVGDPLLEPFVQHLQGVGIEGHGFTQNSKYSLVTRTAQMMESGRLRIPPYPDLIEELRCFRSEVRANGISMSAPNGEHDDLVIALALAVAALPDTAGPRILLGPHR